MNTSYSANLPVNCNANYLKILNFIQFIFSFLCYDAGRQWIDKEAI